MRSHGVAYKSAIAAAVCGPVLGNCSNWCCQITDSLFCDVQSCRCTLCYLLNHILIITFFDGPDPTSSWKENTFFLLNGASAIDLVVCTTSSTSLASSEHLRILQPVHNSSSMRLCSRSDLSTQPVSFCSGPCDRTALLKSRLCFVFRLL